MIHLALKTEFSFKQSFLHMNDIHKYVVDGYVGVADVNNTFGHIPLMKQAEKHGFKPIYGVRLNVLPKDRSQRTCNVQWIFIAKNTEGLKELYKLVETAYDQFYYIPKIYEDQISDITENIFIISPIDNVDADYSAIGPGYGGDSLHEVIAIDNNNYQTYEDKEVYELLAGSRKHGNGYSHMFEDCIHPQHILTEEDWMREYNCPNAMMQTYIANEIDATIPKAEMVAWTGSHDMIEVMDYNKVKDWTPEYDKRLMYELNLIKEKDYTDYFLIVADLIKQAKKTMLVGPSRGSSAGSLVCYLMGITEVDPIIHTLIFERFIDVNRFDLPDIDIDFPDKKRESVIKYLRHKYGKTRVMCLANINRLKPKSAIAEFAKGLSIPPFETDQVKAAIIERSGGDARSAMCIKDTYETTEAGQTFIKQYPKMALVSRIEDHASHAGKHAAGIIVSTLPLCNYGSLNNRDEIIMMDKKDAEHIGLLKIDCLGLRTLSILEGVAEQIGEPYDFYYSLPLDDAIVYKLFNDMRLAGIFQFEGLALQTIVKSMGVNDFNDITAITALARPGALNSGGTARYIKYSTGVEKPTYYSDIHRSITGDTYGIVVYQEQMMEIARQVGGLSWADTSDLRRAASKSMGDEFFGKYKDRFIEGALENGYSQEVSDQLWVDISASGSWSFNKSHAVSYGLISYWTAWCKTHHPIEFAVASLNHAADINNAVKLLRDLIKNEHMDYVPVDPDKSGLYWTNDNGVLLGGLMNVKGIGLVKARKIINARKGKGNMTPSLFKAMMNPKTDFDIIFPAKHYWGHLYSDPISNGLPDKPMYIKDIDGRGEYMFLGKLVDRNVRDLNEHVFLVKRNMEKVTENQFYINFKIEDDTDLISCMIDRNHYEHIGGREIAEGGRIGLDWYLVRGKIKSDWRRVDVLEIINLNQYFNVEIK